MGKSSEKKHGKSLPNTVIGIDIGGTGIKGGIVDLVEGEIVGERFRVPTPQPSTPEAVAEVVAQIVAELSTRPSAPGPEVPVGVTFPAIIQHGIARSAANVDQSWVDTDVDGLFSKVLDRDVHVINDADAAGLAEVRYGAGKGVDGTVLVITLGTGIGSAFIFDGKLVPNAELGHLEIDGYDAETRASAVARERDGIDWDEYSVRLQRYFSHVEFLFSPELFIVGGGISKRSKEYLPGLNLRTRIIPAQLRNQAGIVGAALQAALHFKRLAKLAAAVPDA
ncbi:MULTISPECIES: polyphosphate--glucose phosphotransferase [unclassified Arthrobacter]|uniref:polyphosphate--glucose phosphotransferase n=1 Tax=unclassified Arthrobacter TaxID=235627 RepID=UPI000305077C|nr:MULTISPECIES: ROK family protein [unclassified Arthrobacter]PVE19470.1 ROK family protein [Arthrobacter sp. Bz4]